MEDLVEHAEGNGGGCLVAAMGAARELVELVEQTDPERFGRDQRWQRCVAPIGASVAGQLLCKTILAIVSAKQDSIQYFLGDPRNLAAGAASMPEVRVFLLFWLIGLAFVFWLRILRGGWSKESVRMDIVGGILIGSLLFAVLKLAF